MSGEIFPISRLIAWARASHKLGGNVSSSQHSKVIRPEPSYHALAPSPCTRHSARRRELCTAEKLCRISTHLWSPPKQQRGRLVEKTCRLSLRKVPEVGVPGLANKAQAVLLQGPGQGLEGPLGQDFALLLRKRLSGLGEKLGEGWVVSSRAALRPVLLHAPDGAERAPAGGGAGIKLPMLTPGLFSAAAGANSGVRRV